jgi:hypothetical protein
MPDAVREDRLAEVFTRFRSEAQEEIRPPGTDAARRSAHRRRTIRIACVAAAVTLVGATAAVMTVDGSDLPPTAVYPTLGQPELAELVTRARVAVAGSADASHTIGEAMAGTQTITSGFGSGGSSPNRLPRGEYDLTARCLGRGTVDVVWDAPGPVSGNVRAVCGGDTVRARFATRIEGLIRIKFKPDAEAAGRAGIAVSITDPILASLRYLARDGLVGPRFGDSGTLTGPVGNTDRTGFAPGTYMLRFACRGRGSVTAALTVGTKTGSIQHSCAEGSEPGTVTVTTADHSTEASVALTPDPKTGQGLALFAYYVGTG